MNLNTPPVVKNLLIINIIFFAAYALLGDFFNGKDLNELLGLHYMGAENFKPIQFLTYMFLHANIGHIFMNLFGIWMFGRVLEQVWGPKRFIIYYFVTGIGAALIQMAAIYFETQPVLNAIDAFLASPTTSGVNEFISSGAFSIQSAEILNNFNIFRNTFNSLVDTNPGQALTEAIDFIAGYRVDYLNAHNMVGASGALFGVLLAFGMLFPNMQLYIIPLPFPIKAKWLVIGYGLYELYSTWQNQPGDNVAHIAHLGGMIFGFIMIKLWGKGRQNFY